MDLDDEFGIQEAPRYRFAPDGEEYMLATDAAKAFGKSVHELFGIYPSMSRRKLSSTERAHLQTQGYHVPAVCTIVRATEVDEVLANRTARNVTASHVPEHIAVPRSDKGYLLTRSVHRLEVPPPEAGALDALRTMYKNKSTAKPKNLLQKSYGSVRGVLKPKKGEPDMVPIMINVEKGGLKFKDHFLWDRNDKSISPRTFSAQLCKDEELPLSCAEEIAEAIGHQIEKYSTISDMKLGSRLVTIKLNVQLGTTLLQDKFIWDHAETAFTPEQFAEVLCADLGVGGGFIPLVACSIREQLIADKRRALQEDVGEYKPPLTILQLSDCYHLVGETGANEWSPTLSLQSWSQLEKQSKVADREARLRKRNRDDDVDALGGRGRRSGRARKDVSYAPKTRRSIYSDAADTDAAAAAAKASHAADADLEAAVGAASATAEGHDDLSTPSERVAEHIRVRRGVDIEDGQGIKALRRLASSAPVAGKSSSSSSDGVGSLRHAGVVAGVGMTPVMTAAAAAAAAEEVVETFVEPIAEAGPADGMIIGGGSYREVPRGHYKDNYLNRRLGRVGQKKNNYGNAERNQFYFAGGTTRNL